MTSAEQDRSGINQPGRNQSGDGKTGNDRNATEAGENRISFLKLPA
jgi:hypothetical protein